MAQDRRLVYLLHRAARAATARVSAKTIERVGVSATQLGALSYIAKHPGCSMSEVAELLDLNKSAMSSLIVRLERAELVRREPNPRDARGMCLYLAEEGRRASSDAAPVFRRAVAEMTEGFTDREVDVVLRFLDSLVDRFGKQSAGDEDP